MMILGYAESSLIRGTSGPSRKVRRIHITVTVDKLEKRTGEVSLVVPPEMECSRRRNSCGIDAGVVAVRGAPGSRK